MSQSLIGQTFNELTVIEEGLKQGGRSMVRCRCSCGKETVVRKSNLLNGNTKSCGHLRGQNLKEKALDLTGQRFGALTVLGAESINGLRYQKCQCDCGNIIYVLTSHLRENSSNKTTSCGCHCYRGKQSRVDYVGQKFGRLTVKEMIYEKDKPSESICVCDCGKEIRVKTKNLKSGNTKSCGCLKSKGEFEIRQVLESLGISFKQEYSYKDLYGDRYPLKFDFFLPDYNTLIEYQGQQHYSPTPLQTETGFEKQVKYDERKRKYCKDHNITLIEIPYWDFNKINQQYILNLIKKEK